LLLLPLLLLLLLLLLPLFLLSLLLLPTDAHSSVSCSFAPSLLGFPRSSSLKKRLVPAFAP
jgi:hypothetical protein